MNFLTQNKNQINWPLKVALLLWGGYFVLLGMVDWIAGRQNPQILNAYGAQILIASVALLFGFIPFGQRKIEQFKLPIVLTILAILPSLIVHVLFKFTTNALLFSPEGMTLRITPVLLIGLLLASLHYELKWVILYCFGPMLGNFVGILLPAQAWSLGAPPPHPIEGLLVTFIQTFSLILVGYFTNQLISNLRKQQSSLEEANFKLRLQAITQEELTISRERNRLARELHDTLAHTLTGLTVQLQAVSAYWEVDSEQAKLMLEESLDSTRHGLTSTRRALQDLRAVPLEDLGLALALGELADTFAAKNSHLTLRLHTNASLPIVKPQVSQTIYRIVQAALANVDFHANATRLEIKLSADAQAIWLRIEDNGVGFDVDEVSAGHWGIQGMHERAKLVDGTLNISSKQGEGTLIELKIPLEYHTKQVVE